MIQARVIVVVVLLAGLLGLLASFDAAAGRGGDGGGVAGVAPAIVAGQTYDKWWAVLALPEPAGDHPLYPPDGPKSGSTTWRCKECHGWDYKGADGAYGKGSSHYTGIPGVYGSTLTSEELFDLIKFDDATVENGHGYGAAGVTDEAINHLVEFLETYVLDTDLYIDGEGGFIGDVNQGEVGYFAVGSHSCVNCHGPDGAFINFGSVEDPEYVGTLAAGNPWELLHKIRFGHPNTPMPSWLNEGGSDQGAADIGLYCQTFLPTTVCQSDTNHDGVVNVDDLVKVLLDWGQCQ